MLTLLAVKCAGWTRRLHPVGGPFGRRFTSTRRLRHPEPVFPPQGAGHSAFLIYAAASAATLAVVQVVDLVAGARLAPCCTHYRVARAAATVRLAAGLVLLVVLIWIAIIATHWSVFDTLLRPSRRGAADNTSGLGPAFRSGQPKLCQSDWLARERGSGPRTMRVSIYRTAAFGPQWRAALHLDISRAHRAHGVLDGANSVAGVGAVSACRAKIARRSL